MRVPRMTNMTTMMATLPLCYHFATTLLPLCYHFATTLLPMSPLDDYTIDYTIQCRPCHYDIIDHTLVPHPHFHLKHFFRDLHIKLSFQTNFQLEWTILKFLMTSPTTPFWTDILTFYLIILVIIDKCILGTRQTWNSLSSELVIIDKMPQKSGTEGTIPHY